MSTFLLEIVTPERIVFAGQAAMITAPSASGMIGILPNHVSLYTRLVEGEVKVEREKGEDYLAIGSGFLEVTQDKVILLVTSAYRADEINEKEMIEARERAKKALEEKRGDAELFEAESIFRRSTIALNVLRKRRKGTLPAS